MVVKQGEAQALVTNWTAVEKALGAAGEWDHIEAQRLRFQEELGQDVDSAHVDPEMLSRAFAKTIARVTDDP